MVPQIPTLTEVDILKIRTNATSVKTFACNLMTNLFLRKERAGKNVYGSRGGLKDALDSAKIKYIKDLVFAHYNLAGAEREAQ